MAIPKSQAVAPKTPPRTPQGPGSSDSKKPNVWLLVSIVLVIALVVVIVKNSSQIKNKDSNDSGISAISSTSAGDLLLNFVNEIYAPQIGQSTLQGIKKTSGLYQVNLSVSNEGEIVDQVVFVTQDGKFFIPQVIDIDSATSQYRTFIQQQLEEQKAALDAAADAPTDDAESADTEGAEAMVEDDDDGTDADAEPTDDTEPTE